MKLDSLVLLVVIIIIYGFMVERIEHLGLQVAYESILSGLLVGALTGLAMMITGKWFKHWSEIRVKWYVALPIIGLFIIFPAIFL